MNAYMAGLRESVSTCSLKPPMPAQDLIVALL